MMTTVRSVPADASARTTGDDLEHYDLVVIGAGSAGIAAARAARRSGARVLLVDRSAPGSGCLWAGTVASKALIAAARTAQQMRTADRFGIRPVEPEVNFGGLMDGIRQRVAAAAAEATGTSMHDLGVEVITGDARFAGPEMIMVGDRAYGFDHAVIATGSAPLMPPIPGLMDSSPTTPESLWELRFLPEKVTVLGGGPTGCELGQALARLGSAVTIIEQADRLLPAEEPEVSKMITERFRAEGITVLTGTTVQRATAFRMHRRLTITRPGDRQLTMEAGLILVAAGRRPTTVGLDLPRAGVFLADNGYIATDNRLRTSNRRIFAAGDAIGDRPLANLAELDGEIAAANALSSRMRAVRHDFAPQVVFTDPEIGRVGHTELSARSALGDWLRVRTRSGRLDRAVAENESPGLTKVISNGHGRMVGATVVSPRAGEVISELAMVMQHGGRIGELATVPHASPTWADAVWEAALADQAERQQSLVGALRRR